MSLFHAELKLFECNHCPQNCIPRWFPGSHRYSASDNPLTDHRNCGRNCKKLMFHCILHYAKSDRKLAQELKKQLQSLMLVHLNGHYPARVQLLPDVVPDCVKAKALREILDNEMTATFIILRTTEYVNDSSAQETGFRITTVGMEEPTFRVIQLFFEQEEPTTSDYVDVNITYQENSSEFLEKMVNILKGTSFEEGLNHDEIRRKCEEGRSKIHRRLSLQDHSAAKRGFQRRNTMSP